MHGTRSKVLAARKTLAQTCIQIERRLKTEPAWLALERLEASPSERAGVAAADDPSEARSRLAAKLDASVPEWRWLAGIKAAIAALDAAEQESARTQEKPRASSASQRPDSQLPPLTASVETLLDRLPHVPRVDRRQSLAERIRSLSEPEAPPTAAELRERAERDRLAGGTETAGPAPGGLARMATLESEIERLLDGKAAGPGPAVADPPTELAPIDGPSSGIEEAEVEIVSLAPTGQSHTAEPAQRQAPINLTAPGASEFAVSQQAYLDEASVEIIILDASAKGAEQTRPSRKPDKA
jgi:hypothetical protein